MREKANAMVLASFAADALALGVHWVYSTRVIDKKFGRLTHFVKPMTSYHASKSAGEFTHYGDQMLTLLESVAAFSGFNIDHFSQTWQNFFKDYEGYFDQATKGTLENFVQGKGPTESGSSSEDLSGAARIAPLAFCYRDDLETLVASARAQALMTHKHPHVADAAEFFARVVWKVLRDTPPCAAIQEVLTGNFDKAPFQEWVTDGMDSKDMDTRQAIGDFGQMCEIGAGFPGTIHLIVKYEGDLKEALVENIMAGGDSSARGMAVGLILGASLGHEAIPEQWLSELRQCQHITELLNRLDRE